MAEKLTTCTASIASGLESHGPATYSEGTTCVTASQQSADALCQQVWQIWEEHTHMLRQFLQRRTRDKTLTDDLLSEVLIKTYKKCERLPSVHNMQAWLVRIAQNSLSDHYRQRKLQELPAADILEARQEELLPEQQLAICLRELLTLLPEEDRLPLQWADLEGVSQQEVARRVGISLSGAKSRIQRARLKLRQKLEECCAIEINTQGNIIDYTSRGNC